jgi:uncharacterized protein (TIRG00374 family)
VHDVNFTEIFAAIKSAKFLILFFAFLLHFVGLFLSSVRWRVLLKAQNINSELKFLLQSYLAATFFNHFLPSTVGGDSVRTFDSWKLGENKEKAFAVVILDRFLGLLTLLIFAIISIIFSPDIANVIPGIHLWMIVLSFGAAVIIWFMLSPPMNFFKQLKETNNGIVGTIAGLIHKVDIAFSKFSGKKESLIVAFLLSFVLQFNVVLYYYGISYALSLNVTFIDFFLIVPLTIFVTMLPISFNGLGLRENALFLFLAPFGVLQSQAIAFAWIEYSMLLVLGVIGGIVYMLRKS